MSRARPPQRAAVAASARRWPAVLGALLVAWMAAAATPGADARADLLEEAYSLGQEGDEHLSAERYGEAEERYSLALDTLKAAASRSRVADDPRYRTLSGALHVVRGVARLQQGRPLEALRDFEVGCGFANADACRAAGRMYVEGLGVGRDLAKASDLLTRGCRAGDEAACADLGRVAALGGPAPKHPLPPDVVVQLRKDALAAYDFGYQHGRCDGVPAGPDHDTLTRALAAFGPACSSGAQDRAAGRARSHKQVNDAFDKVFGK